MVGLVGLCTYTTLHGSLKSDRDLPARSIRQTSTRPGPGGPDLYHFFPPNAALRRFLVFAQPYHLQPGPDPRFPGSADPKSPG